MEHFKSRNNDFFHFTNPHDDRGEFEDDDYEEHQYYDVSDDDRSCDFNFHTYRPIGIAQTQPHNYQSDDQVDPNDTLTISNVEHGTFDNGGLVFEIDRTMTNLSDKLQFIIEGIGTRVTQLADETCKLDKYVEDVKHSAESYHGTTHKKLQEMQSILQEVQDGVQFLRDKYEIAETQLQLTELQASKIDQRTAVETNILQQAPLSSSHPSGHFPSTNLLKQLPSNGATFSPVVSYIPPNSWSPGIPAQQYPFPPNLQCGMPYQPLADPQFPQSPKLNSHEGLVTLQNHPLVTHHSQEAPFSHSSRVQHFPPQPPTWPSTHEAEVGFPHIRSSRNYKSELHAKYMPEAAIYTDIHRRIELPFSHETPILEPVGSCQISPMAGHYRHLPVTQELPPALPTASDVENESCLDDNNGNTIPSDDIVEKITAMGFRRDVVKASVRRLTENGSPLDLNVVLDRVMNNK